MQENKYSGLWGVLFIILSLILLSAFLIFEWVETQQELKDIEDNKPIYVYECERYIKALAGGDYQDLQRVNRTHYGRDCERINVNNGSGV